MSCTVRDPTSHPKSNQRLLELFCFPPKTPRPLTSTISRLHSSSREGRARSWRACFVTSVWGNQMVKLLITLPGGLSPLLCATQPSDMETPSITSQRRARPEASSQRHAGKVRKNRTGFHMFKSDVRLPVWCYITWCYITWWHPAPPDFYVQLHFRKTQKSVSNIPDGTTNGTVQPTAHKCPGNGSRMTAWGSKTQRGLQAGKQTHILAFYVSTGKKH